MKWMQIVGSVLLCIGWALFATVSLERPESQAIIKVFLGFGSCLAGLLLCLEALKRDVLRELRQRDRRDKEVA